MTAQNANALQASDRPFSQHGFLSYGQSYPQSIGASDYGRITGALDPATGAQVNLPELANGPLVVNAGQNGRNINDYHTDTYGVSYPSPTFSNDYANSAREETLIPNSRLRSYTLDGDYKLTDHITANFSRTYNTNNSSTMIGGYPIGSSTPVNGASLAAALGFPAGSLPAVWYPVLSANSYYNPLPGYNLQFNLYFALWRLRT